MDKKKIIVPIIAGVATLGILSGATFAYFSATVKNVEQTETNLQSNKLGLIYTGDKEIKYTKMIPGDSFKKTFTVENVSNRAVDFNIFMQGITNEFNEDLVYVLEDEDGVVVTETVLPTTNTDKTYLKQKINIDSKEVKSYTLTVTYKYLEDVSQNDYQGKEFKATLGIDTEGMGNTPDIDPVLPPQTTPTKIYDLVSDNDNSNSITVGDEIAVGDEHFYVISNNDGEITAFSSYNLDYNNNIQSPDAPTIVYGSAYVYNDSTIKPYVDSYVDKLNNILPDLNATGSLISKDELETLGCQLISYNSPNNTCADAPDWVYATSYWTKTVGYVNSVWVVSANKKPEVITASNNSGIRPVITFNIN